MKSFRDDLIDRMKTGWGRFVLASYILRLVLSICAKILLTYSETMLHVKGTQDWDFFWLRFWNLYYFFISYVKILRFYQKKFLIRPLLGEIQFFCLVCVRSLSVSSFIEKEPRKQLKNETKEEGRKIGERDTSSGCEYLVYVRLRP